MTHLFPFFLPSFGFMQLLFALVFISLTVIVAISDALIPPDANPAWKELMGDSEIIQDFWHGYIRHRFVVANTSSLKGWIVEPNLHVKGMGGGEGGGDVLASISRPWSWTLEFPDEFTKRTGVIQLLGHGFHHAHIEVGNSFGSPKAIEQLDAFYQLLVKKGGLNTKVALVGLSRGGLYAYRFAARFPDRVACIYADAPVCDFKSWPGGRGKGRGSPKDWKQLKDHYGFASDEAALAYKENPIDLLDPVAKAKIPILHIVGDNDDVVPVDENSAIVESRLKDLGLSIQVIHKPGMGHHPHGLEDPTPVVKFITDSYISVNKEGK